MGLVQRRITTEYKEKEFPKWKSQIDAAAGFDVPLEVKWDTLPNDDYEDRTMYFEYFDKVYFRPLVAMLKNICIDDMGRNALKESLKKVVIDGTDGYWPGSSTFENGVFHLNHKAFTNVDNENERTTGWQKMIEAKL